MYDDDVMSPVSVKSFKAIVYGGGVIDMDTSEAYKSSPLSQDIGLMMYSRNSRDEYMTKDVEPLITNDHEWELRL